jgi:hypothetical protein
MAQTEEARSQEAVAAIATLLNSQEAQVLGAIGLFIGYLCIFLTKLMNFTQPYIGVLGVIILTTLLLLLGKQNNLKSPDWWLRSVVVIVLALILSAPQLYFAWTVSVAEVRANALQLQNNEVQQRSSAFVAPNVKIDQPKSGAQP